MQRRDRRCYAVVTFFLLVCLSWTVTACGDTAPLITSRLSSSQPLLGPYSFTPPPSAHAPSGRLIFADLQFPATANPLFASSTPDFLLDTALWASPVFYDQQFHVHPDQLTEVPLPENGGVLDQGKTIVMHLRHDLRWSDGQPIVASDFQYWWRLNQDANTGATLTSGYDQIASIDVPDSFTVILHLNHPFGPYLFYLPYAAPQHAWGKLQPIDLQNTSSVYQAPQVTSGPYKMASLLDGKRYTLVPNLNYKSTTFRGPFVAQLVYQAYDSAVALSDAVRRGEVDVSEGYREYDLPTLAHLPANMRVLQVPTAAYEHLDFNTANPLLQDLRVRRAIQQSIDICGIIQTVLHLPDCSRRATQVEPSPSLYADAAILPSAYNPAAAKNLLAQVGWLPNAQGQLIKAGQVLTVHLVTTNDNPLRMAVAQAIQRDLVALGIQVQVTYASLDTFFGLYTKGGILATGAYDLALFTYANSPEPDDEYAVFHSSQIPDRNHPSDSNYGRVNDPIIDQSLELGRDSVAFPERVAAYHRFLERLSNQVYVIPLYVEVNLLTVSASVQNVFPNPNQVANLWNISDWWVVGATKG